MNSPSYPQQPAMASASASSSPEQEHAASTAPGSGWPHPAPDQASLSVMHPDVADPEWRYYHGAWGG